MIVQRRHGPFIATTRTSAVRRICQSCPPEPIYRAVLWRRRCRQDALSETLRQTGNARTRGADELQGEQRGPAKDRRCPLASRTVFYTPSVECNVGGTPTRPERSSDHREHMHRPNLGQDPDTAGEDQARIELVIIDEADRLSHGALECARDLFDRADFGLILIGMPGIEKRMARYPQLYSRVGFAHHFHPLQGKDLSFVTTHHCRKVCSSAAGGSPNARALATIARITGGNFRLLHRLLVQIERVLKINRLTAITVDVIDAARSMLVIGAN